MRKQRCVRPACSLSILLCGNPPLLPLPPPPSSHCLLQNVKEFLQKALVKRQAVGEKSGDPVRVVVLDLAPVTGGLAVGCYLAVPGCAALHSMVTVWLHACGTLATILTCGVPRCCL